MSPDTAVDIAANLAQVRQRITTAAQRADRDPARVRLVAVTKTFPADVVRAAFEAGVDLAGENYVQEARTKLTELADLDLEWHFIGRLQTNKAKEVVTGFTLIHSVDRLKLARELNKRAGTAGTKVNILIQVNLAGEETKGGTDTAGTIQLIREAEALDNISVQGLMTMPPFFDQPERVRPFFDQLAQLAEEARQATGLALPQLSMGMSGDFETAIEAGATLVRVGSAIFGARTYK